MIKIEKKHDNIAAANWCEERFGEILLEKWNPPRWDFVIADDTVIFRFTDEKDAMLFALKWL